MQTRDAGTSASSRSAPTAKEPPSGRPPRNRLARVALGILLTLAVTAWYSPYFFLDLECLIASWGDVPIADDAFYFLQIARHVAAGHGPTFDGVHPTTGYQPLWLFVLAAVQWCGNFEPRTFVWVAFGLAILLLNATAWLAYGFLRGTGGSPALCCCVAVGLLLSPIAAQTYFTLCEACLQGCLFLVVVRTSATWFDGDLGRRGEWALGFALGLFFLARLDGFFLIAGVLGFQLLVGGVRRWRSLLRVAVPVAAIGVGHATCNALAYGHVMPISGALKSLWSGPARWGEWDWWRAGVTERLFWFVGQQWFETALGFARALVLLPELWLTLIVLAPLWLRRSGWRIGSHQSMLWIAVASFLPKHLYYALLQGRYNDAYCYFTTEYLTMWLLLGVIAIRLREPYASKVQRQSDRVLVVVLAAALLWANAPRIGELQALPTMLTTGLTVSAIVTASLLVLGLRAQWAQRGERIGWMRFAGVVAPPLVMLVAALPPRAVLFHVPHHTLLKSQFADVGRWIHEVHLTEHGTVGAYSAGIIGYWAGGDVTNLDGLVGDWEWFEMSREKGMVPPPRGEAFVADYYPPLKQQLIDAGYVPCLDEMPHYYDDEPAGDQVWVVARDRVLAAGVYGAVLGNADVSRVVRVHAMQAVLRRGYALDVAAQWKSAEPVGLQTANGNAPVATLDLRDGDVVAFDLARSTSPEPSLRMVVDGRPFGSWTSGVHVVDLAPLRDRRVDLFASDVGIVVKLLRLP